MKKVIISLAMIALLTSCGAEPAENTPENVTEVKTTTLSACDEYFKIMTCDVEKSNQDEATKKMIIDGYKDTFAKLSTDEQKNACEQALILVKQNSDAISPDCRP